MSRFGPSRPAAGAAMPRNRSWRARMSKSMPHRLLVRACVVAFLCVLTAAADAAAQTPVQPQPQAPPRMEFEAVIKQAVAKNPTLIRAATSITRADLLLQESRLVLFPIISGTIVNSTLDGARGFAGGITQPQNQSTFAGNVTMPVLAPARWAQIQQARDQIAVAEAATAEVRQQISVAAAQAYLAVIAARRQVDVTTRALESAHAHLDYATKRFEGGAGSPRRAGGVRRTGGRRRRSRIRRAGDDGRERVARGAARHHHAGRHPARG